MEQQAESMQWEDQVDGAPFVTSLQTLHGPLCELLDFMAMVSEEMEHFMLWANIGSFHGTFTTSPTPSPDLSQSVRSLDFSPPSHHALSTLEVIHESQDKDTNIEEGRMEHRREKGAKHEEGSENRMTHKHFPAHLTNDFTFRSLAGVHRDILEGLQHVESLVWQRYRVAEVLQDDFAISHLLNVGFLDSQYLDVQYWELLPYMEVNPYDYLVYEDSDSDDEMAGYELQYPDSADMQSVFEDRMRSPGTSQATSAGEDIMHADFVDAAVCDYSTSSHVSSPVHAN
ncbi:hypothetical protein DFH09DRAFT_1074075 [Mycena vulgaris]|nr:hypothetical protein DFH09DRAFT_1074075 [Mycena vulgaris]